MPHDLVQADVARGVRLAARAMARHGLAHAYGHVSARIDDGHFLVSPPQPLGTVEADDPGVVVRIDGELPARALPEVRIHREIYRRRPQVGAVCRFQSPAVMALSALGETPHALHGLGTYFAPFPPLWSNVQLVRDDERAVRVAEAMGENAAIVLRGNGAVTAGGSIEEAAAFAFFLEDAARIELALLPARAAGRKPREYTPDESARRAVKAGALIERMWHFLCSGDPEWRPAD
ncbi:MAG TPA: class II aldolase/adducin family protein [Sphingomonas sp.]